jgi:anti-sigma-K factor RskA
VRGPVARQDAPAAELPLAAARAALLQNAPDVVTLAWTATADASAKGASGDVVWSAAQQRGFMRFSGLAANDPKVVQYQLWMFDAERDERYPVDGGVFDVTAGGDVIVPITPRVRVAQAKLFAVTVEAPGGVVVSKRERIVTTAAPKT